MHRVGPTEINGLQLVIISLDLLRTTGRVILNEAMQQKIYHYI